MGGGRPDRGAFEHSLIGSMVLWQSVSYRKVKSAPHRIRNYPHVFIYFIIHYLTLVISCMKTDPLRAN